MFSPRDLATWTRFGVTFQGNAMDFFPANSDKANSIQPFLPSYIVLSFQENSWSWIIFLDAIRKNPSNLGETMDHYTTWIESKPTGRWSPASSVSDPMNDSWGNWLMKLWMRWGPKHTETPSLRYFFEDEGVVAEDVSRRVQYCQCSHQHGRWVCEEFYDFKRYFGKVTNLGSL